MKLSRTQLRKIITEQVYGKNIMQIKRYFYTTTPFTGFRDVEQDPNPRSIIGMWKPRGLWYACGSSWKDWVLGPMGSPHWYDSYNHLYEIVINPQNVLFVTTAKEFEEFQDQYLSKKDRWKTAVDWPRISRQYAGIEICPYRPEFRMEDWYNPWDAASGCIWHEEGIVSITEVDFNTI